MKICTACEISKELECFGKRKASKDGLSYICKSCKKIADRTNQLKNKDNIKSKQAIYYQNNKDKIKENSNLYYYSNKDLIDEKNRESYYRNREKRLNIAKEYYDNNKEIILGKNRKNYLENATHFRERLKNYYENNKDKCREYNKKYKQENKDYFKRYGIEYNKLKKEVIKAYNRKYKQENKEKLKIYWKNYWKVNKYKRAWRTILYRYLKQIKSSKTDSTYNMLGYSFLELKSRIECQFKLGMSWDNYGEWHIDHKKPIFEFKKNTSAKIVNMLSNLQPLWATENLNKGKKWRKKQY